MRAQEEHARAQLAKYQRYAQNIKKLVAKWRRNVRYYERRRSAASLSPEKS